MMMVLLVGSSVSSMVIIIIGYLIGDGRFSISSRIMLVVLSRVRLNR